MRVWSYGVSPQGLGLLDEDFWELTPREYYALRDVQQTATRHWAISQAAFCNAHFVTDDVPFTADDFLGMSDRQAKLRDRMEGSLRAQSLNRQLAMMKPTRAGDPEPPGLPVWARRDFGKKPPEGVSANA